MKGMIFNVAEKFIVEHYGEDMLDDIIDECTLITKEPFVGPGTYPDEDLVEIVVKAAEMLKISVGELLKKLGRYSFGKLRDRHPEFVTPFTHPKPFLKSVEGVIHVEVKKLIDGVKLPTFQYADPADDELIITYFSERKLYPFMEGLIQGVADHFETPIEQKTRIFEKEGFEFCDYHIKFN